MYCLDLSNPRDLSIMGDFFSEIFKYVKISFQPCDLDGLTECASLEDQQAFIRSTSINLFYRNSFVDVNVTSEQEQQKFYIDRDVFS
jgi:hypothetical protein